jgi:site-specific DNA-methyltransferase (adenine-specific)
MGEHGNGMKSEVFNEDCMAGMAHGIYKGKAEVLIRGLDDESVGLCIADPPYGISFQSAWRTEKSKWKPKIQNDEAPFIDWIEPLYEKMAYSGRLICFYRWDVQDEFLNEIERCGFTVKSQIVWDKIAHGMGDLSGEFAPQHELMIYATKGRFEFAGNRPKTIYRVPRVDSNKIKHPNEKPVQLMAGLIRDLSTPGDLIVEPFGGSFPAFRASIQEGRRCIAFECDDHYFDIGQSIVRTGVTGSLFIGQ